MSGVAASMREAALRLLSLLRDEQRRAAAYPFADGERLDWKYTPGPRGGISLAAMDPDQRDAALALLRTGLSTSGFATASAIIALEPVLREIERRSGRPGFERRDSEHYWFSVFGSPEPATPWGWRVGGHHVCVHLTVVGEEVGSVPLFFGANPARAPGGLRVLGAEEDLARAFVRGLDQDQAAQAVLSEDAPADILTGNARRAEITAVPTGIGHRDLTADQRIRLDELVALYTGRPANRLPVHLQDATFAWLGSTVPGQGHYYAVRAGALLIEYDNTQNHANHVHTVVRDVTRDWGEDLLTRHYAAAHG